MNPPDIYQKVDEAYQNNHQRLINFFQHHGYDEQQAEQLTDSMKRAVFFLETHEYERGDIEIQLRKEVRTRLKKEAEALKKAKVAKELALTNYLEAKRIKNTYMLTDLNDDDDSDMDDSIFSDDEINDKDE